MLEKVKGSKISSLDELRLDNPINRVRKIQGADFKVIVKLLVWNM